MRIYKLRYDKKDRSIKLSIEKDKWWLEIIEKKDKLLNDIYRWNDIYCYSYNRKLLKEYAKDIKKSWIDEAERNLEEIKNIKI